MSFFTEVIIIIKVNRREQTSEARFIFRMLRQDPVEKCSFIANNI